MTTTIRANIADVTPQFWQDLKNQMGEMAQIEIKVESSRHGEGLFSVAQFWEIIEKLDWSHRNRTDILAPAVTALAQMPISNIYLFQDFLAEKLYHLDTRLHAKSYMQNAKETDFSVDDFLYVRCAVVAEGQTYYETVLNDPTQMPAHLDFEHLLDLAAEAYHQKTGKQFTYTPIFNYETKSNKQGWA